MKRTCHHEPNVEPDALERGTPITVLWGPLPKMQTIEMPVEREELTADCTDHVY